MYITYLNATGGSVINSFAVGSGQTITTQGENTERSKYIGLFVIHNGTVNAITRQVSFDNTTFYTPYDKNASLSSCISTSANNSRYVALNIIGSGSGQIIAPWVRYNVTMLSGGTLTLVQVADESL